MSKNKVLDGLFGLCVGDALGVPAEGKSRDYLTKNPVKNMIRFGAQNQYFGIWSDDSSLTFCLADSLCNGHDLIDIADKFVQWLYNGLWTPYGKAFGIGNTTSEAIYRLKQGNINPVKAGLKNEYDNGNGSLMRILPLAFVLQKLPFEKRIPIISDISSITHAHRRSIIACVIYIEMAINLLNGQDFREAYINMKKPVIEYYAGEKELGHYSRILEGDISGIPEEEIKSSGYVVHTLEASLWCILISNSYKETVLKAINLGGDTDTTGAVAGGLAGIYYGFESIPEEWVNSITRKDDIVELAEKLDSYVTASE